MAENDSSVIRDGVVRLYALGYSAKDICGEYRISAASVRRILRKAGFDTSGYRKASERNTEKVLLLIKAGYPYRQIEQLLYVSTHLIREIVLNHGLTGFAPKYHHPIALEIEGADISQDVLGRLREAYLSGSCGLAACADTVGACDQTFLWFVYHLSEDERLQHRDRIEKNVRSKHAEKMPVTAIAKQMDISPAIVKKILDNTKRAG